MTDQQKALEEALSHPDSPIDEYVLIFHPECGGIITGAGEFRCDECGRRFNVEELWHVLLLPSDTPQVTCTKERLVFNAAACKILRHVKLMTFLLDEENGRAGVGRGREGDSNSYPVIFDEARSRCSVEAGLFLATTGLWDSGTHECRRGQGCPARVGYSALVCSPCALNNFPALQLANARDCLSARASTTGTSRR